jgi:uncharacterized membrane protein
MDFFKGLLIALPISAMMWVLIMLLLWYLL